MKKLDAIRVPLTGKSLFEASAGTGKTYTIASLYLRYIVEQPLGSDLQPENILVVTFTRKATAELRDRIRARLHQAVACFRGQDPGHDDVIKALVDQYGGEGSRQLVLKRLHAAEKNMDDAAIFTIHSFCHRALNQNAFTSGAIGGDLIEDETELVQQACEDFWRQAFYPLSAPDYKRVAEALKLRGRGIYNASPSTLANKLSGLLSRKSLQTRPTPQEGDLHQAVLNLLAQETAAWDSFRQAFAPKLADVGDELKSLKGARKATIDKHINALGDWLAQDTPSRGSKPIKDAHDYIFKKNVAKLEDLPVGSEFVQKWQEVSSQGDLQPYLLRQALNYIGNRLEAEKHRLRVQAPDDLMKNLSAALNDPEKGPELAKALRKQYPVAMIDEFQDTDPLQFNIFQHIYGGDEPTAWLMIGDPKQSIYAFRGADIHTYVGAKTGTSDDNRYTLDKNYRSAKTMVEAVNDLFGFCDNQTFLDEQISYQPVDSQDQGDKQLLIQDQPQPALTFWSFAEDQVGMGASQCAQSVVELLNGARAGDTLLAKSGGQKPLGPGDIAILVRDRHEAGLVAGELRKRQVRSVFLSRDSVFATPVAEQLLRLMRAFHEPRSERLLLAALATPLCNQDAEALAAIRNDEEAWQGHQSNFENYQQIWLYKGILSAIHQWMSDYRVPLGLLNDQLQGERDLADLMHAAELLQAHALKLDGSHSLLRHFQQLVETPDDNNRSQQRRLESDSELVQIVTIHASKGLEYPVVMLPFGLAGREAKEAIFAEGGDTVVDFTQAEGTLAQADEERLAEDVRLLYVALTRAVYACYVGLTQKNKKPVGSALGYLLNAETGDLGALQGSTEKLVELSHGRIARVDVESRLTLLSDEAESEQQDLSARPFGGQLDKGWRVTSYSGMSRHQHTPVVEPGAEDEQESAVEQPETAELEPVEAPEGANRFTFQKGAQAGNALHYILEQKFSGKPVDMPELITHQLQACGLTDHETWMPVVEEWMDQVCATPVVPAGPGLDGIPLTQMLPEMEFHLKVSKTLHAGSINRVLGQHPVLNMQVRELDFSQFHGLIKGFIDLLFEWDGKYYVCDYKSNHLGNQLEDYSQEAMSEAMGEHRYDAQMVFYTLALHRFLKQQLIDYDYDTHIGGGVYLFLRGMSPDNQGSTGVFSARPERALIEQLDQLMGGQG